MIDVAVIGGGVSGLTAAFELKRRGHQVTVLERQVRTGGNAISENINGFLMEHGPSTINASMPEVSALSGTLGISDSIVHLTKDVKNRYLVKDGKLNGISAHPLGFLKSDYLSVGARLRLLAEVFVPKGPTGEDETVDQYFTRRFGAEFSKLVMDPLMGGLYAARSDELSLASVFPKLLEMEKTYGSISKAAMVRRFQGKKMPAKRLYSWSGGIATLPNSLGRILFDNIRTGVTVRSVRISGNGFEIDTLKDGKLSARTVLIATQPHVAAPFLENLAPSAAAAIHQIAAPPLAVVFMGYKRSAIDHPLDGLGYLSPSSENRSLTGAQIPSSMFQGRAPEGYVALSAYLSSSRHAEVGKMRENDLVDLAQQEFRDLLDARGDSEFARVRVWPRGIPQYRIGHDGRKSVIQNIPEQIPGLYVTGNYLSGPSVGACVAAAKVTAKNISCHLNANANATPANRMEVSRG
jgi:protoporphyrinogen/coproporphyrinogen III oxidase